MINLSYGANIVVLTLTENTTISDPNYLFEFVNETTNEKIYFIAQDTSLYTDRYNKFLITLSTEQAEDLLYGVIHLSLTGYYTYNVYQQSSSTNLNPDDSEGLVETGKVLYNFTPSDIIEHDATTLLLAYE
jgi:hypothetical protein